MRKFSQCLTAALMLVVCLPAGGADGALGHASFYADEWVRLAAEPHGDIFAAGRDINIDQTTATDIFAAGQRLEISDSTARKIYAVAESIDVGGDVSESVMAAARQIRLWSNSYVGGYVMLAGDEVNLAGQIDGDLSVASRHLALAGIINGDAHIAAENVVIGPQARIKGDLLLYQSGRETSDISPEAIIDGDIKFISRDDYPEDMKPQSSDFGWGVSGWLLSLLSFAILGIVAQFILPRALGNTMLIVKTTPWRSLAIGFGLLVALPLAAGLLAISIIGIPLALALLAFYALALAFGLSAAAHLLGSLAWRTGDTTGAKIGRIILGMLILGVVSAIPFLGGWFVLLAICVGLGALATSLGQKAATA